MLVNLFNQTVGNVTFDSAGDQVGAGGWCVGDTTDMVTWAAIQNGLLVDSGPAAPGATVGVLSGTVLPEPEASTESTSSGVLVAPIVTATSVPILPAAIVPTPLLVELFNQSKNAVTFTTTGLVVNPGQWCVGDLTDTTTSQAVAAGLLVNAGAAPEGSSVGLLGSFVADQQVLTMPVGYPIYTASMPGLLAVTNGAVPWPVDRSYVLNFVSAAVGTPPQGQAIICDLAVNGTSAFSSNQTRPTILANETYGRSGVPQILTVNQGDILTASVLQVGTTYPGSNLSLVVTASLSS